jgi:hypothetical protein
MNLSGDATINDAARWAALHDELRAATAHYQETEVAVTRARNAHNEALTRLNVAQTELVKAVDELRKAAPFGTVLAEKRRGNADAA